MAHRENATITQQQQRQRQHQIHTISIQQMEQMCNIAKSTNGTELMKKENRGRAPGRENRPIIHRMR